MLAPSVSVEVGKDCDTEDETCEYEDIRKKLIALRAPKKSPIATKNGKKPNRQPFPKKTLVLLPRPLGAAPSVISTPSTTASDEESGDEEEDEDSLNPSSETALFLSVLPHIQATYQFIKRICRYVYMFETRTDGSKKETWCIKIVHRRSRYKHKIPIELRMLSHIKSFCTPGVHHHLQIMKECVLLDNCYAFIAPYVPDIAGNVVQKKPGEIRRIMQQLLCGLHKLHKNNIIHRDIKLSNLLWDGKNLTIADFDKATWNSMPHHIYVGTDGFHAPEVWRYERDGPMPPKPYTEKCDIFSAGMVFGALLFGLKEGSIQEQHATIFRDPAFCAQCGLSPACTELLTTLLRYYPEKRPSACKALKSAYFASKPKTTVVSI